MKVVIVAAILNLLLIQTVSSQSPVVQGMIIDVQGDLRTPSGIGRLEPLAMLWGGDSLVVAGGGRAKILWMDGSVEWIESSRRIPFAQVDVRGVGQIVLGLHTIHEWFHVQKSEKPNHLRRNGATEVYLRRPRNTRIRTMPSELKWEGPAKRSYTITLRCYDNGFAFNRRVTDLKCLLENQELEEGLTYYWFATYEGQAVSNIPAAVWFSVLTKAHRKKLETELRRLEEIMYPDLQSPSFTLLKAQLLANYELYDDACALLESTRNHDGKSALVHATLAFLYDRMDMEEDREAVFKLTNAIGQETVQDKNK